MDQDDKPVGYLFSRREAIALLSAAGVAAMGGAAWLAASPRPLFAAPNCIVRPAQIEGPYFVDDQLNRSDIRTDPTTRAEREGVRLDLAFQLLRMGPAGCQPLPGAMVDVWQCDAVGVYSDVRDTAGRFDTRGQKFLRGYQVTDAAGVARFVTIFPGWYQGRPVHIHLKVRTPAAGGAPAYEFTSQVYFDDTLTAEILAHAPYAGRGDGWARNNQDRFYRDGGDQLMLAVERVGNALATTFSVGLELG
jgi:protocatechuate 3,4-dioxygenase beta subunit